MAKTKEAYVCPECGEKSIHWLGQCRACKAWNSLELKQQLAASSKNVPDRANADSLVELSGSASIDLKRVKTGLAEVDRLFGGGIVTGSLVLLGGEPGIGKSTLLLEIAKSKLKIAYFSGEESQQQVLQRAKRIGAVLPSIKISHENYLANVLQALHEERPELVFIDSIQTLYSESGMVGSISQVRDSCHALLDFAKKQNIPVIMTGHITKEGSIAGPKQLEHAVDVVLYFESSKTENYRFVRAVKNRFGSIGEIAIFEMTSTGLREVKADEALISLPDTGAIGSVIFPQVEGSRVIPVEIQVLVTPTGFSNGRRIGENIDVAKIHLAAAILEKYMGYKLSQCDIFVKIAGGGNLHDNAADLAIVVAMASSFLEKPLDRVYSIAGEVSLTGQVRKPSRLDERRKAMKNLKRDHFIWGGSEKSEKELYFNDLEECIKTLFKTEKSVTGF